MRIGIEFEWIDVGEVRLGANGKLEFPKLPTEAGVYAFRFAGGDEMTLYVGEAENLQRRAAHYRNPGPTQQTNIRLNESMRAHLTNNGRLTMHLISAPRIELDGSPNQLDLSSKFVRRLLENAALMAAGAAQKVENL